MSKTSILIVLNKAPIISGIEKTLLTLLKTLSSDESNDITLLLQSSDGILFPEFNSIPGINIYFTGNLDPRKILKDDIKHFRLMHVLKSLYYRFKIRSARDHREERLCLYRMTAHHCITKKKQFDCAISYTMDYDNLAITLSANTKKHIAFVHGDCFNEPYLANLDGSVLKKFEKIYCVSETAKSHFAIKHPVCQNTVEIFHNIFDEEGIREKSAEPICDIEPDSSLKLCTVGRLSPEEGQDMIPDCAEILLKNGVSFKWFVLGVGSTMEELQKQIHEKNVQNNVFLLGERTNPYPYMKACDIYVQPSYTEAYCTTVIEALILGKAIVSTNFTSVKEQLRDGETGLICEMTPESIANTVMKIANDKDLKAYIEKNVSEHGTVNSGLDKFYEFIRQ